MAGVGGALSRFVASIMALRVGHRVNDCLMTLDRDSHPPRVTSAACKMTLMYLAEQLVIVAVSRTTERTKDRKTPILSGGRRSKMKVGD